MKYDDFKEEFARLLDLERSQQHVLDLMRKDGSHNEYMAAFGDLCETLRQQCELAYCWRHCEVRK